MLINVEGQLISSNDKDEIHILSLRNGIEYYLEVKLIYKMILSVIIKWKIKNKYPSKFL